MCAGFVVAENLSLMPEIRYQDAELLVISKPAGWVVHPGAGSHQHQLTDYLAKRFPKTADLERQGIVHRLDKDTSGLLMVARTARAKAALSEQLAQRQVMKKYLALVDGLPQPAQGKIDAPITRHHADRTKMAVRPDGKPAVTTYRVIQTYGQRALLELGLQTGRTHQLRVHLAALGYPITGDAIYGRAEPALGRQFLHATRLTFHHPKTATLVSVDDPLPPDLQAFLTTQ